MQVTIVKGLFEQIVAMAAESPIEICGLLFGDTDRIDAVEPCRNVAADPSRTFEIDPGALIAAHRALRVGGPRIVGSYHSHPVSGMAWPSPRDAAAAEPDGSLWLIATHDDARLFRAVAGGRIHALFDPVDVMTCDAACSNDAASPEGAHESGE